MKDTPPMVLAVSSVVAVSALPVTSPVKGPVNLEAVTIPANVELPLAAMVAAVPTFTLVTVIVGLPVNPAAVPEVF